MTSALVNNVLAIEIGLEIKYKHICMICRKKIFFFRFVFVNDVYMSKKVDFTQQSGKNQVILSVYHFICCVVFFVCFFNVAYSVEIIWELFKTNWCKIILVI